VNLQQQATVEIVSKGGSIRFTRPVRHPRPIRSPLEIQLGSVASGARNARFIGGMRSQKGFACATVSVLLESRSLPQNDQPQDPPSADWSCQSHHNNLVSLGLNQQVVFF
jgi:hypothetical protein